MDVPTNVRGAVIRRRAIWTLERRRLQVAARPTVDAVRNTMRERRHPLPTLQTSTVQAHAPTILVCMPDFTAPAGGIRVGYRHVDILNEAGIPAAIVHRRGGFRCTWFDNSTRVVGCREVEVGPQDLVVVPELAASLLARLPGGFRFVVFNQNPHLTWKRASPELVRAYSASPGLAGMLTVSAHGVELLQHISPSVTVLRTHNSIDPRLFFPSTGDREQVITYMPRRGRDEARQVLGILSARGALSGWRVVEIDGLTDREVGDRLRESAVFLSLAYHEGFGLPAAEAMACGAYVVGFDGFGGREFFRSEFCSPVAAGDVMSFARTLEEVLRRQGREPGWCERRGAAAARFIAAEYSPERERADVVGAYSSFMTRR